jgi:hypothetical protein
MHVFKELCNRFPVFEVINWCIVKIYKMSCQVLIFGRMTDFLGIIHRLIVIRFGDWNLSPSPGKTYSVGPSLRTGDRD